MKALQPVELQLEGNRANRYHVRVDPRVNPAEDIWKPQFWVNCTKLSQSDIVRVEATDGSYDFSVKVVARTAPGGKQAVRVEPWPNLPQYVVDAFDSASEMVPTVVNGKPLPRVEFANADLYRVIGFDGNVASKGYTTEAQANVALGQYMAVYGIKSVADREPTDLKTGNVVVPKADKGPVDPANDPNLSFAKRKELADKAKKDERRAADLKALEDRKAANKAPEGAA